MARILVIDDQTHVRAAAAVALQALGHEVVGADSGPSGLRAFQAAHFDAVVVDVFMPEMDGIKLIRALRERQPSLPVVAVSGVFLPNSNKTALELLPKTRDLSDVVCLRKPFRPADLSRAIGEAMAADAGKGGAVPA